jgi:hypothetical protein
MTHQSTATTPPQRSPRCSAFYGRGPDAARNHPDRNRTDLQ